MSDLTSRKTKCHLQTADCVRECGQLRQVILEAHPLTVDVRLKGLRTKFTVSYAAIYHLAARMQAEQVRREKREAKRGK